MNTKFTTLKSFTCTGLVLVLLIGLCSCSKEQERGSFTETTSKSYVKGGGGTSYFAIGHAQKDSTATLNFDKDIYECIIGKCLEKKLGGDYVFEDIKIIDEYPFCSDSIAALQQTLFNVKTGETVNLFSILEKDISNNEITYYATPNSSERRDITCTAKDCGDGCKLNSDKTGCTKCGEEKGSCTATDAPNHNGEITWKDVIGWTLVVAQIIVSIILASTK